MDLDDLIVEVCCLIDETLAVVTNGRRLRQRGPDPLLSNAEVLTMEVVGEFLGLDQDTTIFAYFRHHYAAWFPPLRNMHRPTFTRHAANLWAVKAQIWLQVVRAVPHDPGVALIDSFPLPVCRSARARRCRLFEGEAAFGHDEGARYSANWSSAIRPSGSVRVVCSTCKAASCARCLVTRSRSSSTPPSATHLVS